MECTQVLLSESFDANSAALEKCPVATLLIDGEYHTIYNTENVIGRDDSCDIVINNNIVSSRHAVIEAEDSDAHLIYDLGSTNKTKLGKIALKPHVRYHINDGDQVTFGNVSAQYNISMKHLTSPIKGNATLNSCSIPESPERLTSTLESASSAKGNQKDSEGSVLELSDTDLFGEKEADADLYLKEIPSSQPKTNSDIYELDTLSFDENIENSVKQTAPVEHSNKINVIPGTVEVGGCHVAPGDQVSDKGISKGLSIYDKHKEKNNFAWENFPDIASPVGLDSSNPDNLDCPKSKISSSFLDITNAELKSDQQIPKNIGGVILSDLCKPDATGSKTVDINEQVISSTSNESGLKIADETEKELCPEETSTGSKNSYTCDLKHGQYSENDCYIPLSQNIDMFEESPGKRMGECHEQDDVYEMLTQVSIENEDETNLTNSIYDIQTQVVIPDDPESKIYKENESSFILPPRTEYSILEPATQPYNNDKEDNDTSYSKVKVIDETDNNFSFSSSTYEAETQACLQNIIKDSEFTGKNQFDKNMDSLSPKKQNKNTENIKSLASTPQSIAEISKTLPEKIDQNDSVASSIVEVATQPCPLGSVEILDSMPAKASNNAGDNENLSTTIIEAATQLCSIETSIDASKDSSKRISNIREIKNSSLPTAVKPQFTVEEIENDSPEKKSATDLSLCDWYEIATQPCRTISENLVAIEKEIKEQELTKNNEVLEKEVAQSNSFSISLCQTATQPCPKVFSETRSNLEGALINDENSSLSTSICDIATQSCPKDIFSEKIEPLNKAVLNSELTTTYDENNKNISFSASICEIATQPCPKVYPEKTIDETSSDLETTLINDKNNKNSSFSTSIYEIATQPCPKDIPSKKNETILNYELTTIYDENDRNSSFSTSLCEIATQPSSKDSFPEKNESIVKNISNSELTIMNQNSFSISACEIATQPCSLAYVSNNRETADQSGSVKNGESTSHWDENYVYTSAEETKPQLVATKVKMAIDTETGGKNMLPPESIQEVDTIPLAHIDITPNILNKSAMVVKESLNVTLEEEGVNFLKDDKTKNLIIPESVVEHEKDTMPQLDATISDCVFEVATQPVPCRADLNIPCGDQDLSLAANVLETSGEVVKVIAEVAEAKSDVEKARNIEVTHKPPDISLTATLPNSLSDSFFEAATQPYKNDQGQDRTFPDPLTSICNNLSDDKIEEITDELMYGNISAKLEDKNKTLLENNCNKEFNELQKQLETSDSNIYEALTHQIPLRSLLDKVNPPKAPEKISTQDLQRILECDDLTQKYDEFKKTSAMPTVSHQILNSDSDLLKSNARLMKDKIQDSESSDISKDENIIDKAGNDALLVQMLSDSVSKSSLAQDDKQNISDNRKEDLLKVESKKVCRDSDFDFHTFGCKAMFIDSDSSQELNIRSNKKRANLFPPDSQSFTDKFLENDDSSQELNIRSNKKRANVFPPDSQSFTNKLLENEDSSQELSIRSNKKRANVFPPDSQSFTNKLLENDDSSQELNIKSNKKRCNVFSSDSQDLNYKNLESANNISEQEFVYNENKKTNLENATLVDSINEKIIKSNEIQKPCDDDVSSKIVRNTSVENHDQPGTENDLLMNANNLLDTTTIDEAKTPRKKLNERTLTSGKRKNKETKNKLPTEHERESSYISRGNITLHSPKVLSELEEQFRLTKVAMSPTQLSVVSDIDDEILLSQEVNEADAQGIRKSVRNRKTTPSKKSLKNNKSPDIHTLVKPDSRKSTENLSKENENKIKEINSFSGTSKIQKSFKKFQKVSPIKNNSPNDKKLVKVGINEVCADIVSNSSDNSQNSEELGRGKRKRTRTSYEGFIIEEEKKRTSRKKLSFSNSEDSENMNNATVNTEEINNSSYDELSNPQSNDVPNCNRNQTVSVVLYDIKKVSADVSEPKIKKSKTIAKKNGSASNKVERSYVSVDKASNVSSCSTKDEVKAKQNEITFKDKNSSYSFSEKLDELFNIWGPADRVKLSPRAAKKSYKLLAGGKTEPAISSTSGKNVPTVNTLDKEPKTLTGKANKNNLKTNEKISVVGESTSRKRNLSQKNEGTELSDDVSKQNKKRKKTNSENSETSLESVTNDLDSEVRKSTRITRNKTLNIPVPVCKPENNPRQAKKTSGEMPKRTTNRSIESIEDGASVSNKNFKANTKNSNNSSMKPPLSTVIVNVRNKNLKAKEKKSASPIVEKPTPEISEENYCFSQEYSFHENKIEKGRKKPSDICSNEPLKIRRSGRKKTEKTAEKNIENVMFTGYADKKTKSLVNALGGQIVESPFTCTVLVTDKIRRTTKLLSALSRGLPIVSPQWLIDSNENGRFLDSNDFLLLDKEAETMFSFNLKKSIEKAQNGKVLDGWAIFVTPSVKPSPEEMKSIIECSGGRFLPKELTRWPANSLIVSCDGDRAMWPKFSKKGKTPIIVDSEAILLGALRQELDLESHKLL